MEVTKQQKIAVLKRIFSEDIECFGRYFFSEYLSLETPQFHKEILKLLQSDEKRIGIAAPRGHAKSTLTDLIYLSWAIVHNKANFVLLCSDTYSQAVLFLDTIKAEFEKNDLLRSFYGEMKSNRWSEGEIIVNGIMVKAVGAGMKVRGLKYLKDRPDLILVDDLENDELVMSKARREKLERWVNGALMPCMAKGGRFILIGTVLHYDSLLMHILNPEIYPEFTTRLYSAIMNGKALWPEHLNLGELEKIKENYVRKGQGFLFYQEYMNDPVSDENRKFKTEKTKYYEDIEIDKKQLLTYITYDRAYSTEKTADFTGIIVVSVDRDNNWYVRQAERFKGDEQELIERMFDLHKYWKPSSQGIEQKAYEYTLKKWLEDEMRKRNQFFVLEPLKDGGSAKNQRIEGLLPRFLSGSIYFKRDQTDLLDELYTFPMAVHDDLSDALAYMNVITQKPNATKLKKKSHRPMTKYGG